MDVFSDCVNYPLKSYPDMTVSVPSTYIPIAEGVVQQTRGMNGEMPSNGLYDCLNQSPIFTQQAKALAGNPDSALLQDAIFLRAVIGQNMSKPKELTPLNDAARLENSLTMALLKVQERI